MIVGSACGAPILIIGVVMVLSYRAHKRDLNKIEEIVGALRMYRRVSIFTVAQQVEVPPNVLDNLIFKAVSEGRINAYIDRTTGEIFIQDALAQSRVENIRCKNCGAMITGMYMIGETVKCLYCETTFKIEQ